MNLSRGLEAFLKNLRKPTVDGNADQSMVVEALESRRLMSVAAGLSGDSSVNEGHSYTLGLSGSATSPTPNKDHWTINWGDGSGVETVDGSAGSASHFYADGSLGVQISATLVAWGTVTGSGTYTGYTTYATSSVATKNITVADVAPTRSIAVQNTDAVYMGDAVTLSRTYSDVAADPATSWLISWGDGHSDTITGNPATFIHEYDSAGSFTIGTSVVNKDGTFACDDVSAVVKPINFKVDKTSVTVAQPASGTHNSEDVAVSAVDGDGNAVPPSKVPFPTVIVKDSNGNVAAGVTVQISGTNGDYKFKFVVDHSAVQATYTVTVKGKNNDADVGETTLSLVIN